MGVEGLGRSVWSQACKLWAESMPDGDSCRP